MKTLRLLLSILIVTVVTWLSVSAHAALINRGNGLIYDSDLNITWLQNANLASQLTFGVSGITSGGQMSWYVAQNYLAAMNAAKYLGYSNWQLPQNLPVNGSGYNYNLSYDGSTDYAYNISGPGSAFPKSHSSELAYMYYVNLGNNGVYDTSGNMLKVYGVTNPGPFINLAGLPNAYAPDTWVIFWSGTVDALDPIESAWSFRFDLGLQYIHGSQSHANYIWPILPGDPAYPGTVSQPPIVKNVVFAVSCGGPAYTSESGFVYQADTDFTGGATASNTAAAITSPPLYNVLATDSEIYYNTRYGNFSYNIPLSNGNYTVILKFAETYWNAGGKRVFNVNMQGQQVITNLDIFSTVGMDVPYDVSLPVSVTNGMLNIVFTSVEDSACVSGIVVTGGTGTLAPDTTPPSVPAGLSALVVSSSQINLAWTASTDPVVPGQVTSGLAGYKVYRNGAQIATTTTTNYSDSGLSASTTYSYAVSAYDAAGNVSAKSSSVSATTLAAGPPPPTGTVVFAANAGGPQYTSPSSGVNYQADADYSGGYSASTAAAITGTSDPTLYQTERYGSNFSYNIPLANGNYTVTLKFAEIYWTAAGKRIFNVSMQGTQVISKLDIYAQVGKNVAYDLSFPVSVTNGTLNIAFTTVADNAKVSAIEITSGNALAPDTTPPTVPAGVTATAVSSSQINISWAASTDPLVTGQVTSGVAGYKIYRNGTQVGTSTTTNYTDAGLTASTTYSYTVSAYDAAGNISAQSTAATATTQASSTSGNVVFADNAGGGQYTDTSGNVYKADTDYSGGYPASTTAAITGTVDPTLYQTERYGNFSYNIPLANGNYTVTLKFAEIYWTAAGKRIFNVSMQGTQVISNLDIYAHVGKNVAYDLSFPVSVTNGTLNITFTTVADNAKVSAISVTPN